MKGVPAAAGSGDRLTVTLFLAGVFHLILILGISFAPPVANPGRRADARSPARQQLRCRIRSANEDANYLAERTQRAAAIPRTARRASLRRAPAPRRCQACRRAASRRPCTDDSAGGEGKLLTGAGGQPRFIADAADANSAPASQPRETFAGSPSPFAGSDEDAELAAQGRAAPRTRRHAEHADVGSRGLSRRLETQDRAGRHGQLPECRPPQQAVRQSGDRSRARLERRARARRRAAVERLRRARSAPQWTY